MKYLHIFILCCFSVVLLEASAVMEVSGFVGGQVSIHCSGNWTADNSSEQYNLYFCKGVCSRENTVVQTTRKMSLTQRGRYTMEVNRGDGAFKVTIMRLKKADTETYHCGVGNTVIVLYQEVNLTVLNESTVSSGSPLSTTTLQTETKTLGSFSSRTAPSPVTQPSAEVNPHASPKLKETTLVIIVSVSLALLVCAIIPLIFCRHCRICPEAKNKTESNNAEADCSEKNEDVACSENAV